MRPLLLALVAFASACASGDGMQTKLRDASTGYNRSLRWGDFDTAADFLPADGRDAFMARHDEVADDLVIVDYEVTRLELDKQTGIAASRAEITWHTDRNLVVKTTTIDQLWQWHEGNFVLVDERRVGGTPLAVFAEAAEDPHPYLPGLQRYRAKHEIGEENKPQRGSKRRRKSAKVPDEPTPADQEAGRSKPPVRGPT